MSLTSMFGPSTDQLILGELHQIRQDIADLHQDMNDRFDRIDSSLNAVYVTMNAEFSRLDIGQQVLIGDVASVQADLLALTDKVIRGQQTIRTYVADSSQRELKEAINGGLNYQANYGVPIPVSQFTLYENTLYSYAHDHSLGQLEAGELSLILNDSQIRDQLNSAPLDANVNYIVTYLNATNRFLPDTQKLPSVRLPNAITWATAAEAYVRFIQNNPRPFPGLNARLEAVRQVGAAYASTIHLMSRSKHGVGAQLIKSLVKVYTDKITTLDQQVQGVQQQQTALMQQDHLNHWIPLASAWPPCNPNPGANFQGKLPFPADSNASSRVFALIPNAVKEASVLTGKAVQLCYEVVNYGHPVKTTVLDYVPCSFGRYNTVEHTNADLHVTVHGIYDQGLFVMRSVDGPTEETHMKVVSSQCNKYFETSTSMQELVSKHWIGGEKLSEGILSAKDWDFDAQKIADTIARATKVVADTDRAGVLNEVRKRLENAELHPLLIEVDGLARMIDSVMAIAFPTAVEKDDLLRSMIMGDNRLPGVEAIYALYDNELARSASAGQPANPVFLSDLVAPKVNSFTDHIQQILDEEDSGVRDEQTNDVHRALADIDSLQKVLANRSVAPAGLPSAVHNQP